MAQLAPAICPVCDTPYSEKENDEEIAGYERFYHFAQQVYCVLSPDREPLHQMAMPTRPNV